MERIVWCAGASLSSWFVSLNLLVDVVAGCWGFLVSDAALRCQLDRPRPPGLLNRPQPLDSLMLTIILPPSLRVLSVGAPRRPSTLVPPPRSRTITIITVTCLVLNLRSITTFIILCSKSFWKR
ncbi:uncharacterized protein BDZ99DRAFT_280653 [Mytilinidion resinicola]|uniref:Uncharacterized protein n=1 Tax=Mytilinidion resinicola TaxID=574789 RepID=A0A6A6YUW4_9PEZI|nr:uncharacterized protein BDZ99DRAFT_280653 [Mytilinidion resinicola]KAF2811784.1 hypothetical protein BDZ99DRAFT_280653 [Mytilinidion resinicola]